MDDLFLPIAFPLCLVRCPSLKAGLFPFLTDQFGWLLGFGVREDAMHYVRANPGAMLRWITKREAVVLLADMHILGTPGVRLNAGPDPSSGEFLLLSEFAEMLGAELPEMKMA
jgi:hypothetical protein